ILTGNIRRSAMIALCSGEDVETFLNLKSWEYNVERRPWMHLSNNSIKLLNDEDFVNIIPMVAEKIRINGEPGLINMVNVLKFGRVGDETPRKESNIVGSN